MSHSKVLLLEDNQSIQLIVKSAIGAVCELTVVDSIAQAERDLTVNSDFSLAILDVLLPDGDGFTFCEKLKANEKFVHLPVIFLTGQSGIEDRVHGFALGADDYIVKPIEPKEFTARVVAKLRRKKAEVQTSVKAANFEANLTTQKIFRMGENGTTEELPLTPIEFRLFVNFLQNEGKIFSRKNLVQTVWGASVHVTDHTVDTHISALRKKIGESAGYLKSVLKKGYCFTVTKEPKA